MSPRLPRDRGEVSTVNSAQALGRLVVRFRRIGRSVARPGAAVLAGIIAVAVVVWTTVTLYTGQLVFVAFAPRFQVAVEMAAVIAQLFGALVLSTFAPERSGRRLSWVAGGLLVSGLGGLVFEYADVLSGSVTDPNTATYESLFVWTAASALFAVGLATTEPPRLRMSLMLSILAVFSAAGFALGETGSLLPPLVSEINPAAEPAAGEHPYVATGWNGMLAAVPLFLACAAALGAGSLHRRGVLGGWLLVAMVLLACAQLRALFYPPAYSTVLTLADLLHLTFAAAVALGGVLALRSIAAGREDLLAAEQDTNRRLEELAVMKADFSAMVAHELGGPLATVRKLTEILSAEKTGPEARDWAAATVNRELSTLNALVGDVRAAASVERDDFMVAARPTPLSGLLDDAKTYAKTLPGGHPVSVALEEGLDAGEEVRADPARVGQVLRNLLSNAAKYSPEGAAIELRAGRVRGGLRLEVADRGPGIRPEELARIFEKFGRGRNAEGKVAGAGLGLYLSRRIARAHGSDLTVESTPGSGSVFGLELEEVER